MARRAVLLVLLALGLVLAKPGRAEVPYRTEITGIEDAALLERVRGASQLVTLEDRPPPSEAALRRRAETDVERLRTVINGAGYWNAKLSAEVVAAETEPARVVIAVEPGPLYHLAEVQILTREGAPAPVIGDLPPAAFGLEIGGPARSVPVVSAEQAIIQEYARRGHPLAKVPERRVVIDHGTRTMSLTYTVEPGPFAVFGPLAIDGLTSVEQDFVRRNVKWEEGETYDLRKVEDTRQALVQSGLFASVRVAHAEGFAEGDVLPMRIEVEERPPRSIGFGIGYNSSEGVLGRAFWEHRNLFGDAERLRIQARLGDTLRDLSADFRRPAWLIPDLDLLGRAELIEEEREAYDSRRARIFTGLERRFGRMLTGGFGVELERAYVDEPDREINYTLLGVPVFMRRDSTDALLDPTVGSRQTVTATPYQGVFDTDLAFLSLRATTAHYWRLRDDERMILAGFGAIGSIFGESREALPATKRLYAGGGGSVRGYGYQLAGPLDDQGDPLGGRSSLELGVELRLKVSESIGIAPFLEAGNVWEDSLPQPFGRLLFGAGLGVRYYTAIGPVRFDIAVPLDRRDADDAFQIYISLGQAF